MRPPSEPPTPFLEGADRAGRIFALGLVVLPLVALPLGVLIAGALYAVSAGESIPGSVLDLTFYFPSLVLFGLPGLGIYALALTVGRTRGPMSTLALLGYLPLVSLGWLAVYHIGVLSLALGGTIVSTLAVLGWMFAGPLRRHIR